MATTNSYGSERRHILDRREDTLAGSNGRALTAIGLIAMTLLIVGGVNWGLVGLFGVDLVAELFGVMSAMSRAVYTLVGLSALYTIVTTIKLAKRKGS